MITPTDRGCRCASGDGCSRKATTACDMTGPRYKPSEAARSRFLLKRILVPVDFSACSLKALRYAVPFAERFGADIYLLNVIEPGPFNDFSSMPLMVPEEELLADAQQRLLKLAENEIEELVPVNAQVRSGRAAHEIVELAKSLRIDLIILGTHGHTGLKRVLMGSTTEQVVRQAHCPVFVVREVEHEFVSQPK